VAVEIGDIIYEGAYYVQESVVHVQSSFGSKSTQLGGSPPRMIARMLLSELVRGSISTTDELNALAGRDWAEGRAKATG
jgi:hypothetical protein